jgi:hypothetical protein
LYYRLCDPTYTTKANLTRIEVKPFYIEGFDREKATRPVREVAVADLDLEGFTDRVWFYITPLGGYDMYLGMPWIKKRRISMSPGGNRIRFGGDSEGNRSIVVRSASTFTDETAQIPRARMVSAAAWVIAKNRKRNGGGAQVFAASMADINKALQAKVYTDPRKKLPAHYSEHLPVFDRKAAESLPLLQGPGIDYRIELEKDTNRRELEVL